MKDKVKKFIRCGVRLHPTDWLILKELNSMPICDNCVLKKDNEKEKIIEVLPKMCNRML